MKIAFLNGSPRGKKSASEFLLKLVEKNLSEEFCPVFYNASKPWTEETRKELLQFDVLLFSYPNYYGTIPAPVLKNMFLLEQTAHQTSASPVTVYTIVNCGFFYSNENTMALQIMHRWCEKAGFTWGQGISCGAGGGYLVLEQLPLVNLSLYPVKNAMRMLSCKLMSTVSATDQYVQILMPCKLFTFVAERVWCVKARKNGLKEKELGYFE